MTIPLVYITYKIDKNIHIFTKENNIAFLILLCKLFADFYGIIQYFENTILVVRSMGFRTAELIANLFLHVLITQLCLEEVTYLLFNVLF